MNYPNKSFFLVPILLLIGLSIFVIWGLKGDNKLLFELSAWAQLFAVALWFFALIFDWIKRRTAIEQKVEALMQGLKSEMKNNIILLQSAEDTIQKFQRGMETTKKTLKPVSMETFKVITSDADCVAYMKELGILDDLWKYATLLRLIKVDPDLAFVDKPIEDFAGNEFKSISAIRKFAESLKSKI